METVFQIGTVFLLILVNAYFVASEFALVSVRKTRIDELSEKGNKNARRLQKALENIDRYISATQFGVTIVSLLLGWIGEPAIAHILEPFLGFLPEKMIFITSNGLAIFIAFCLITYFEIVLGELVPKTYAFSRPESTGLIIITPLTIFAKIFSPFIDLLNDSGRYVVKLFGVSVAKRKIPLYSEEEIKTLLRQSGRGGVIEPDEVQMALNVFKLGDIPVKVIMVPRADMIAFDSTMSLQEITEVIKLYPHSRFPVYKGSLDHILGFVHIKDIYSTLLKEPDITEIGKLDIIRKVDNITARKKIDSILDSMRRRRSHMAIVNDEDENTIGLVTLEDVIESLVGEIEDEFDKTSKS